MRREVRACFSSVLLLEIFGGYIREELAKKWRNWEQGEMGVPAFFRWLSKKYPSIVVHCVEEKVRKTLDTVGFIRVVFGSRACMHEDTCICAWQPTFPFNP